VQGDDARVHDEVKAWWEGKQRILNGHPVPARFTRARVPVPVTVRLVWERDGAEQLDTVATAWTRRLVLVDVTDARVMVNGVWVGVGDVRRR
jgi:hypothetical protein